MPQPNFDLYKVYRQEAWYIVFSTEPTYKKVYEALDPRTKRSAEGESVVQALDNLIGPEPEKVEKAKEIDLESYKPFKKGKK